MLPEQALVCLEEHLAPFTQILHRQAVNRGSIFLEAGIRASDLVSQFPAALNVTQLTVLAALFFLLLLILQLTTLLRKEPPAQAHLLEFVDVVLVLIGQMCEKLQPGRAVG